jgi:hypothetical protein
LREIQISSPYQHVSMDGKGRCRDNIFVERLWRTVKSGLRPPEMGGVSTSLSMYRRGYRR